MNTCRHCGNEIPRRDRPPSYISRRQFCDQECAAAARRKPRAQQDRPKVMDARYWPTPAAWLLDTRERV